MSNYIGKGLIVYAQGQPYPKSPSAGGVGLHHYSFTNEAPTHSSFPVKDIVPTSQGYLEKSTTCKEANITNRDDFVNTVLKGTPFVVTPVQAHEIMVGEKVVKDQRYWSLLSLLEALRVVNHELPDVAIVYFRDNLAMKILPMLDFIKQSNFMSPDGKPMNSRPLLEEIIGIMENLKANKVQITMRTALDKHLPEKNHMVKHPCYSLIQHVAGLAANIGRELFLADSDARKVIEREINWDNFKDPKKGQGIHPFLVNKRAYYTFGGRQDKTLFYVGNPGDQVEDDTIGKRISDAQIGIVYLDEGDDIINLLEDVQQKHLIRHYGYDNLMFCLHLSNISSSKVYRNLLQYREDYVCCPDGVPNLETPLGETLTHVHDPVFLAQRNIDQLETLHNVLNAYTQQDNKLRVMDVTDYFYDTEEKTVANTLNGLIDVKMSVGKAFKKSLGVAMKFIKIPIEFGGTEDKPTLKKKEIILTNGVDIPRRNQLAAIEKEYPNIQIISWNQCGSVYRFAFLITLYKLDDSGKLVLSKYGIWRGTDASQILLN